MMVPYTRRQTRNGSKPPVTRLIQKNGHSNVIRGRFRNLWYRYIRDIANTLVDSNWRWTIIALSSCFVLSWVFFALIWMLISTSNGDFDLENPSSAPCLTGIQGFGGYVMFSIETQQTIGYGSRYINRHCPEGTFLMCLQIILGCAICGCMVSIVNAKMVRPLQIHSINLFSKKSVITVRDGTLCLIFRVRDENKRYSMGTTINAYLVQRKAKQRKDPFLKSIALEQFGILIWPLEIVHRITPESPFYDLSAKELITKKFEIIVTMRGTSTVTGQCSKTRTSYLSSEILWGSRFVPCVHPLNESYWVNHKEFNSTEEVLTPLCSAQRLDEVLQDCSKEIDKQKIYFHDPQKSDDERSVYDNLDYDEDDMEHTSEDLDEILALEERNKKLLNGT